MDKKKIFNDPVYGFITISHDLIFEIIQHPYFQRLRRIKQLGLTDLVYPGALHTRFHHAIGSMHLMRLALNRLRMKQVEINDEEYLASLIAILLHDIGHGPFSHTLENHLLKNVDHESLSVKIMKEMNREFEGKLDLAIKIFTNKYSRKFFHQLVSGQLDIDRLDYLKRDSFFTGVIEGNIGAIRIIEMLDVVDDHLVVEEKGIYSIENFLTARKLMYWQVYLHKTTVSGENMLSSLIKRAKYLDSSRFNSLLSEPLQFFLNQNIDLNNFNNKEVLTTFLKLDDADIWQAIKNWEYSSDFVLSYVSRCLLNRNLFAIELSRKNISAGKIEAAKKKVIENFGDISEEESRYLVSYGHLDNSAYIPHRKKIKILSKKGKVFDVMNSTEIPGISALGKIVKKYYLCYPKNVSL